MRTAMKQAKRVGELRTGVNGCEKGCQLRAKLMKREKWDVPADFRSVLHRGGGV
jgi:hypothetical protein